jgi:DNA-directed RNA polymerase specialized sigma subunit
MNDTSNDTRDDINNHRLTDAERILALEQRITELEADLKKAKVFTNQTRLEDLWDWVEDLDCRVSHIKPKDIRPSISTQRSIDKILEALHKKENATQYLTYQQIADLLGVTKGRVCQLRAVIKSDGRLTISEHPNNRKERIVTLNPLWGRIV